MEMLREEIKQLVEEVFYPDWSVRSCGRDKCKQLMFAMHKLFPTEQFGDTVTGCMNSMKIVEFVKEHDLIPEGYVK